ncbi:MAG: FAD-dependent oxidoreductase [Acidobacteria bacterium]|nr:FAD-dependent oxidoreductase [Acidobacteriota bacterium]
MNKTYDVCVVGAGVFGAWTAHALARAGMSVALLDAHGAANSRSSSGGETRVIRAGYGREEIYTRWSLRSLPLWLELFERAGRPRLFRPTGVLWLAPEDDTVSSDTLATLQKLSVPVERLAPGELERRFPQFDFDPDTWGMFEPGGGVLLARRAVRAVVREAREAGCRYRVARADAPRGRGPASSVKLSGGETLSAGAFVYACGPWLPKVFPELLGGRINPTRQEVFFFGAAAGDARFSAPAMPTWVDWRAGLYGIPDIEGRGCKIALDRHGPAFDPEAGERVASTEALREVRDFLAARLPALRDAPVLESRVCQYENTSNGDFLIDRHPDFANVWLVGGGSGHGFKHGPALGEYVADKLTRGGATEPRFSLASKERVRHRTVF